MAIPVYILNLDRSPERYAAVQHAAEQAGLTCQRVAAVDGCTLNISDCDNIDKKQFRRLHGKNILPGEAGCYLSHLKALRLIAQGDEAYGIIVEDDVVFLDDFRALCEEMTTVEGWDVIKLVNHRNRYFRSYMTLSHGMQLGRCLYGPLGSAAAYLVSRKGAQILLEKLATMKLPYDVALERGWCGFEVYVLNRDIVMCNMAKTPTTIATRQDYRRARLPKRKRVTMALFRICDCFRRMGYGLAKSRLKK